MQIEIVADFTLDDLLEALERTPDRPEGFLTCAEWQDALHVTEKAFLKLAHEANARELLDMRKVPKRNIAGGMQPRPAYKFLLKKGVTK